MSIKSATRAGSAPHAQQPGLQLADVQHVVDHQRQVVGAMEHFFEMFGLFRRDRAVEAVADDRRELANHRQRRAKFVRDVFDELLGRFVELGQPLVLLFQQIVGRLELVQ